MRRLLAALLLTLLLAGPARAQDETEKPAASPPVLQWIVAVISGSVVLLILGKPSRKT
jgi:hypothetical protein